MFVIVKDMSHKPDGEKNMRLCYDNCWRGWCHFGSTSECVKTYLSRTWAEKKAERVGGIVVEIPRGQAMNVAGQIENVDH